MPLPGMNVLVNLMLSPSDMAITSIIFQKPERSLKLIPMKIAVMMAIKVMAVTNGMVAVVEVVGLDEVVAATTAEKTKS